MHRILLLVFCLACCPLFVKAQRKSPFSLRLYGGGIHALQALRTDPNVSPLVGIRQTSAVLNMELQLNLSPKWRFGILVRMLQPPHLRHNMETFLKETYCQHYPTIRFGGVSNDKFTAATQGYLALSYGITKNKWVYRPRFLVGISSFYTADARIVLKGVGNNGQLLLFLNKLEPGYQNHYHETVSTGLGVSVERILNRRWQIFTQLDWTMFPNLLRYSYRLEDQVSGQVTSKELEDKHMVHQVMLGVGIALRL
jgi:hypothetical protein